MKISAGVADANLAMNMVMIEIPYLPICVTLLLLLVFVIVVCLLFTYRTDSIRKQEVVDLYDKGYSDGYEAGKEYAYKQLDRKFTQFEYDNTQLALENDSLKKAYKLWLDKQIGELLHKENRHEEVK